MSLRSWLTNYDGSLSRLYFFRKNIKFFVIISLFQHFWEWWKILGWWELWLLPVRILLNIIFTCNRYSVSIVIERWINLWHSFCGTPIINILIRFNCSCCIIILYSCIKIIVGCQTLIIPIISCAYIIYRVNMFCVVR